MHCESAPWSPRYGLGAVVFTNRLWVLGGTGTLHDGDQLNDVWSSADGIDWRCEVERAPWSPRWCHAAFALAGRLWVVGGLASVDPIRNLNDLWSSNRWQDLDPRVGCRAMAGAARLATTIHNERTYLLGGATDGATYYRDVLSSPDGTHWRQEQIPR